ncbi:flagellar biosynthesis anti-sigma factor FlgM [Shewanella gelidii]|uniref:Negative regulator of flagellin synthesis n=1 Tax=Shewanella gelidii TaxID=1642821 RepID=A0A917JH32_9GAMM|nr:flagellar biosynthesis anti-sigma factor FlgM [Shewanella gelidii]MCL1096490.1 flagellar biosynthesis anti-sigma factor FlgM [Shewanella gelidii]GGI67718.1 flagellar biosynthesis anti-sigma factor FlgM [Shewanella gelidii]
MAIDINKLQSSANTQVRSQKTQNNVANSSPSTSNSAPKSADSVMITEQAQQLQGVQSQMSAMPDVDLNKVAEIKAAIAEGKYKVDAEKLAANISTFESELSQLHTE